MSQPNVDEFERELKTHGKTCQCGHKLACEAREEWLIKEIRRLREDAAQKPSPGDRQSGLIGRELDAAVAERVMRGGKGFRPLSEDSNCWKSEDDQIVLPFYSTDIAVAMEVASAVIRTGWTFELRWVAVWMARFQNLASSKSEGYTAQDPATRPAEVICRAALAAVVHNEPEPEPEQDEDNPIVGGECHE